MSGSFSEEEHPEWVIIFEDAEAQNEYYISEKSAMTRFKIACQSWNCHLFKRVASSEQQVR